MTNLEALGSYSEACVDAFNMIELNEELLERVRQARSAKSVMKSFVPIGEVALGGDDMLIPAGVKNRGYSSIRRVAEEMHLGDLLLAHKPELVDALPMFTLPVQQRDYDSGILTEDFTQGGKVRLDERYERFPVIGRVHRFDVPEGLYREVYDALGGHVYREAFGHMMGWVGHREVLVDFNDVAYPSQAEIEAYSEVARSLVVRI